MWNKMACLLESPYNQLLNHRLKEIDYYYYYCFKVLFESHLIFRIPGFPLRRQYSQFEAETLGQTERGENGFSLSSC